MSDMLDFLSTVVAHVRESVGHVRESVGIEWQVARWENGKVSGHRPVRRGRPASMQLYLVTRITDDAEDYYDMFHSFVVAAKSETAAREHVRHHTQALDYEDVWLSERGSKVTCIGQADMTALLKAAGQRDLK